MAPYYKSDAAASRAVASDGWPLNAVNPDGTAAIVQWSSEFECFTVNGVLAPLPLSCVPLDRPVNKKRKEGPAPAAGSPSRVNKVGEDDAQPSMQSEEKLKKKYPLEVKLFKFLNESHQYLLETYQTETKKTKLTRVLFEKNNISCVWEVKTRTLDSRNDSEVQPVTEDPNPRTFEPATKLSLQERLEGWKYMINIRDTGKEETFYYHGKMLFRSLYKMATFIIHANGAAKDLQLTGGEAAAPMNVNGDHVVS